MGNADAFWNVGIFAPNSASLKFSVIFLLYFSVFIDKPRVSPYNSR